MPGKDEETKKIGLHFSEKMSGFLTEGETDFEQGEKSGKEQNTPLSFEVTIHIDDVEDFTKLSGREAQLTGGPGRESPRLRRDFRTLPPGPGHGEAAHDLLLRLYGERREGLFPLRLQGDLR
jgi:hypothetical protein